MHPYSPSKWPIWTTDLPAPAWPNALRKLPFQWRGRVWQITVVSPTLDSVGDQHVPPVAPLALRNHNDLQALASPTPRWIILSSNRNSSLMTKNLDNPPCSVSALRTLLGTSQISTTKNRERHCQVITGQSGHLSVQWDCYILCIKPHTKKGPSRVSY